MTEVEAKDNWSCPHCPEINEAEMNRCIACGKWRRWTCPECNFSLNKYGKPFCGKCEYVSPEQQAPPPAKPEAIQTVLQQQVEPISNTTTIATSANASSASTELVQPGAPSIVPEQQQGEIVLNMDTVAPRTSILPTGDTAEALQEKDISIRQQGEPVPNTATIATRGNAPAVRAASTSGVAEGISSDREIGAAAETTELVSMAPTIAEEAELPDLHTNDMQKDFINQLTQEKLNKMPPATKWKLAQSLTAARRTQLNKLVQSTRKLSCDCHIPECTAISTLADICRDKHFAGLTKKQPGYRRVTICSVIKNEGDKATQHLSSEDATPNATKQPTNRNGDILIPNEYYYRASRALGKNLPVKEEVTIANHHYPYNATPEHVRKMAFPKSLVLIRKEIGIPDIDQSVIDSDIDTDTYYILPSNLQTLLNSINNKATLDEAKMLASQLNLGRNDQRQCRMDDCDNFCRGSFCKHHEDEREKALKQLRNSDGFLIYQPSKEESQQLKAELPEFNEKYWSLTETPTIYTRFGSTVDVPHVFKEVHFVWAEKAAATLAEEGRIPYTLEELDYMIRNNAKYWDECNGVPLCPSRKRNLAHRNEFSCLGDGEYGVDSGRNFNYNSLLETIATKAIRKMMSIPVQDEEHRHNLFPCTGRKTKGDYYHGIFGRGELHRQPDRERLELTIFDHHTDSMGSMVLFVPLQGAGHMLVATAEYDGNAKKVRGKAVYFDKLVHDFFDYEDMKATLDEEEREKVEKFERSFFSKADELGLPRIIVLHLKPGKRAMIDAALCLHGTVSPKQDLARHVLILHDQCPVLETFKTMPGVTEEQVMETFIRNVLQKPGCHPMHKGTTVAAASLPVRISSPDKRPTRGKRVATGSFSRPVLTSPPAKRPTRAKQTATAAPTSKNSVGDSASGNNKQSSRAKRRSGVAVDKGQVIAPPRRSARTKKN